MVTATTTEERGDTRAGETSSRNCSDCGSSLGRSLWRCWDKNEFACDNDSCRQAAKLCSSCYGRHPLIPLTDPPAPDLRTVAIKKYCRTCFQEKSVLDFQHTYESIGGEGSDSKNIDEKVTSDVVFVFVHGGASSRAMFRGHAQELSKRFGYESILLDLPGHGTLVDDESLPLTLDNCVKTVKKVLMDSGIAASKKKVVYVGGSFGAYTGFYILNKLPDSFHAAVLMDCGQNVGPGASLKARMGLVLLGYIGRNFSNAALMKMMLDVARKSKADYQLVETSFGAGMFFDHANAQIECLRSVAPAECLPSLEIPILYMNGSEDYRDSEKIWLELSNNQKSELKVYEGGDHFFTHDTRFLDDILTRMDVFVKNM